MPMFRVIKSAKDKNKNIIGLCVEYGENGELKKIDKATAIGFIRRKIHQFYVKEEDYASSVIVKCRDGEPYLTTEADCTSKNNLDNLPDCTLED